MQTNKIVMLDCQGIEIKIGDFVQLTEGKMPYINQAMKKGFVFKVNSIVNRPIEKKDYLIAFLQSKTGDRVYNSGVTSSEILKVNYDLKKRKIIKDKD